MQSSTISKVYVIDKLNLKEKLKRNEESGIENLFERKNDKKEKRDGMKNRILPSYRRTIGTNKENKVTRKSSEVSRKTSKLCDFPHNNLKLNYLLETVKFLQF